jgi:cell division protein FtsL
MQAPLRRGNKETLGRANGVKRTGRSLLFALLVVGLVTASSIVYTWQRLMVEAMLARNMEMENTRDLVQKRTERLSAEVAALASSARIREVSTTDSSMIALDWKDVIVIEGYGGVAR